MKNKDSFITQAMLSSFLSEENRDYLALLEPFVLKCLPHKEGQEINVKQIQQLLNEKYNLDILYNVVEVLLQRCCKEKHGGYVKREKNVYYVKRQYDSMQFDEQKNKIRVAIEKVIDGLYQYLVDVKKLNRITKEDAQKYLSIFLDYYNYSIYETPSQAEMITIQDECAQTNYYVAQFILKEYEEETPTFNAILELIKGTLVAKSIYYFMYATNNVSDRRINGTAFYLDTSLLIDVLGLNLEYDNQAVLELTKLVKDNGGKVKTFEHYVDEVKGIIYKYAKDPDSRLMLSLDKFNREHYSEIDAMAYMKTLVSRLNDIGIIIEEKPDYSEIIEKKSWHVDYTTIRNSLSAYIDYGKSKDNYFPDALNHDADTIEAIAYLRGNHKECTVFDCKAIFVTKNRDIVRVIQKLYYEERFKQGEINFAVSDVDLTAMVWLSTFGRQSNLPKLKLLENAYAACVPSNRVLNAFINKINKLEESEKISQETALILRTHHNSMDDLIELSSNNVDNVNDKLIQEMESRVNNRVRREIKSELREEYNKLESEQKIVEVQRTEIEERRLELETIQRRITKEKEDNEYILDRQENQRKRIEEEKRSIEEKIAVIDDIKARIVYKAKKQACRKKQLCKVFLLIFSWIVLFIAVVVFSYATYVISDFSGIEIIFAYIVTAIVSVISMIASTYSFYKFIKRKIDSFCERIYDKEYGRIISENGELFEK